MTIERPEDERDDEIPDEITEPTPTQADGEPLSPTLPTVSDDVEVPIADDAEPEVAPELTPEASAAHLVGGEDAAPVSRDELMIVARKLEELDSEIYAREQQRKILARQY